MVVGRAKIDWDSWRAANAVLLANLSCGFVASAQENWYPEHRTTRDDFHRNIYFSMALGALMSIPLLHLLGRRPVLMLSPTLVIACALLQFYRNLIGPYTLLISDGCVGTAQGLAMASSFIYLSEIASPGIRGRLCALIPVFTMMGSLLQYSLWQWLSQEISVGTPLALPPAVLSLFLFLRTPDSPFDSPPPPENTREVGSALVPIRKEVTFDIKKEDPAEAEESDVENPNIGNNNKVITNLAEKEAIIVVLIICLATRLVGDINFLANRDYVRDLLETNFFKKLMILQGLEFIGGVLCALLVDSIGRRPLLFASTIVASGCLGATGTFFFFEEYLNQDMSGMLPLPLTLILTFAVVHGLGLQLPWVIAGELLPRRFRTIVPGIVVAVHTLLGPLVAEQTVVWELSIGSYLPLWMFAICALGLAALTLGALPETRAKTLAQVQVAFKRHIG